MARTKHAPKVHRDDVKQNNTSESAAEGSKVPGTQVVALKPRKPRRYRPGTVALRDIRKQQQSTNMALPKSTFKALVQEVARNMSLGGDMRISSKAYPMLQAAAEDYIIDLMRGAQVRAIDRKGVTVTALDLRREARAEDKIRARLLATTKNPLG